MDSEVEKHPKELLYIGAYMADILIKVVACCWFFDLPFINRIKVLSFVHWYVSTLAVGLLGSFQWGHVRVENYIIECIIVIYA